MTLNKQNQLDAGLQSAIDLYQRDQLASAISTLTKLRGRFPASPKLWGYLGFLYREAKDFPSAVRCFKKAVELSPQSERASLGLFFSLRHVGKFAEALKEMARFSRDGTPEEYVRILGGGSEDQSEADLVAHAV